MTQTNVTYRPNAGFVGTNRFTYTVGDGHGGRATGIVTVVVTPTDSDRLQFVLAPRLIRSTGTYRVAVSYTALDERNLQVTLLGREPNQTHGTAQTTVSKANGTAELDVKVEGTPKPGGGYAWEAILAPVGKPIARISPSASNRMWRWPEKSPRTCGGMRLGGISLPSPPAPRGLAYNVFYRDEMAGEAPWMELPGGPHSGGTVVDESAQRTMRRYYRVEITNADGNTD